MTENNTNENNNEINMTDYGFDMNLIINEASGRIPAKVTAVHRGRFEFVCRYGQTSGKLKSAEYYVNGETFPTTGDFVMIDYSDNSECRIVKTFPRKSFFSRLDPSSSGHAEQAVAANFDYVFIMQSLNENFNIRRLERYLTLAWQSGATPVVILTKADLENDNSRMIKEAEQTVPGVDVIPISSLTGTGLDALGKYLKPGKTVVFLGSSGVGKSSLVNALAGADIMTVNGIREDDARGRHTTTYRQLLMLSSGVMLIDTPGMRELGMWNVSDGIGQSFSDVEKYIGKCRFRDCKHNGEPGCAIRAAIDSGELSPARWESFSKLRAEAKYSDDPESYMRERKEKFMKIAKYNKNFKQR